MNSNTDKKIEEKKYAQLSRESISVFAESNGNFDISDAVAALLAEDVNYRLRQTVQNAGQFMRHAKRRKLSCEMVNKALRYSNIEPIYGYNSLEPMNLTYIKDLDLHSYDDPEVELVAAITEEANFKQLGQPYVKAQWLAVEGIAKNVTALSPQLVKKSGPAVSDHLMAYYDQMTKAILGNDEELLKLAFDDLRTNDKLAPLLPFLVNFVSVGVKKMSHDLTQLRKLLQTVASLVGNPSLNLGTVPYLSLLVQAVQYCILESLAASINPINDHWTLRDSAAQLLAQIVSKWSTPVNELRASTIGALRDSLLDFSKPFSTHYGALKAMVALGLDVMEKVLYPKLAYYWPHVHRVLEDSNHTSLQIRSDAQKVHGALLLIAELMLISRLKTKPQPSDSLPHETIVKQEPGTRQFNELKPGTTLHMYKELYELFGDSLAMRLPYCRTEAVYVPKEEPLVALFTTPETMQTEEELLEAFYEKEEDARSNSMDDDNSYDERDDNSGISDDHETGPVVDLQIKSTINDPALGIKLTIAKLPRYKPAKEEPKTSKKKKVPPPREPEEPEPVFEYVPFRIPLPVYFNFEGALPIPPKVKLGLDSDIIFHSDVWRISLMQKHVGKKRKIDKKAANYMKFNSGCILTFL